MKSWYTIKNLADSTPAISIRGIVGDWGLTDSDLINEINALGDITDLKVSINSNGGDLTAALSLFNFLRNHPAKVTTYIEGVAASAASVIAMAGDTIIMPSNTAMMIHNPWTIAGGDSKEMAAAAQMLEVMENSLVKTYEARIKLPVADIKAMLDKESWLTAQEAFDLGFCDQVQDIGQGYAIAMALASGIPEELVSKLDATQTELAAQAQAESEAAAAALAQAESEAQAATLAQTEAEAQAQADSETNAAVAVLCEAADQKELIEPLQALAKIQGITAVQAILKKTLNQISSGILPHHALGGESKTEHQKTTQDKLAQLSLQALKRK